MKPYRILVNGNDPEIGIKIPKKILRDLVLRSEENGHSIEIEFAIRLARSLERDLEMLETDEDLLQAAFNSLSNG